MTDDRINPVFDHAAWMARAACHGSDINVFFPTSGSTAANAKAACEGCPVQGECLQYAIDNEIHHGVWGGLSERQRCRMRIDQRVTDGATPRGPSKVQAHGTTTMYGRGCRCERCVETFRAGARLRMAEYRDRNPEKARRERRESKARQRDYAAEKLAARQGPLMPTTAFGLQITHTLMEATG